MNKINGLILAGKYRRKANRFYADHEDMRDETNAQEPLDLKKFEAYMKVAEVVEDVFVLRPMITERNRSRHANIAKQAKQEMESRIYGGYLRPKNQEDEDHENLENEQFGNLY